ncbi:MAG: hypothetical protein LBU45_08165 [Azoarcus sp.]|nr:hypothetical protein [Azoarcus sp.]
MQTLSERIKFASDAKGVLQADIARACGINTAAVADWFRRARWRAARGRWGHRLSGMLG